MNNFTLYRLTVSYLLQADGMCFISRFKYLKIKAKVTVNGISTAEVTMTKAGADDKISQKLGSLVTWHAHLNVSVLPDGKGQLHYAIIDTEGNTYGIGPV